MSSTTPPAPISSQTGHEPRTLVVINEGVVGEIIRLGDRAAPREACGIILPPDIVIQCPNRSPDPTGGYEIHATDMETSILRWAASRTEAEREALACLGDDPESLSDPNDPPTLLDVIIWHTHPCKEGEVTGFVGPSKGDMKSRVPSLKYLVVSLGQDAASTACRF